MCILLLAGAVFARENVTADSVKYKFDPIIVTATKHEGPQSDLAATVSVLNETDIRRSASVSALELVQKRIPGLYTTQRSVLGFGVASGAAGGIQIRGVGGQPVTGVLVLKDGRPDMMGLMGHAIPDAYSLDGVERIEVLRGPASFLYGTNAMGGVINIVSKRHRTPGFETTLSGGLGGFQTRHAKVRHGGRIGDVDYHTSVAYRETRGHRDQSDYDGLVLTLATGYQWSRSTRVEMNASLSDVYLLDPGRLDQSFVDHWYDLRRSGVDLTLSHRWRFGTLHSKIHGNFGRHKIYDGFRSTDYTSGIMIYQNARPLKGMLLTAGFDFKTYGGNAENVTTGFDIGTFDITEYAPYLHVQQLFWNRLILSTGLRVDTHETAGRVWLPKVGGVIHLNELTSWRVSAAKGFRSPSIRELYLFPPSNPDLDPERMWNLETGLVRRFGDQARLDMAVFRADGENMIRGGFGIGPYSNSGSFVHTGYEISADWSPSEAINLSLGWTHLDQGDETQHTPGEKLNTMLSVAQSRWSIQASWVYVMDLYGADRYQLPLQDYQVLDLQGRVTLGAGIEGVVELKNLLDESYQTMYGYPMPGRWIQTRLDWTF